MVYFYLGLILIWFILGVWTTVIAIKRIMVSRLSLIWLLPALALGTGLGWWFSDLEYYSTPDLRFMGFPMPVAVFERIDENRWIDFVSGWAYWLLAANFLLGLMTPVIVSIVSAKVIDRIRRRGLESARTVDGG